MPDLTPDLTPTDADRARDLGADMALCGRHPPDDCPWEPHTFGAKACEGWPAALRLLLEALAVLRGLERAGWDLDGDRVLTGLCPSCGASPPGHALRCRLALAIGARREGDP